MINTLAEPTTSRREEAEDYRRVVLALGDGWRIIACRDDLQWILQRQGGWRDGAARFESRRYHRSRDSLIQSVRELCGPVSDTAEAFLAALPAMYVEGRA